MSRARACALTLINWKGVFYRRYELDRHVTAFEGANGAGKTTVMIAAYVVLLPDMTRLRFSNIGEGGSTGGDKGIWGRLGEPGRPAYTVLELAMGDGTYLHAGVHLERKGEPSVEPTPFIIHGLDPGLDHQALFLIRVGDTEGVPTLGELSTAVAGAGGRLQVFKSARDYFAALFEAGVLPLKLSTEEERGKLNDMLHSSMTGGISRALMTDPRRFVLKQEPDLAETLQLMRANLDICRATRQEVSAARELVAEIEGVFSTGQAMFAAAFHAARENIEDLTFRVSEAEASCARVCRQVEEGQADALRCRGELTMAEARLDEAKAAHEEARGMLERTREAARWSERLERVRSSCEETREHAEIALAERRAAEALFERSRDAQRRAQADLHEASAGLARASDGLDLLHKRAERHRRAKRCHAEAVASTGPLEATPAAVSDRRSHVVIRQEELDRLRRELQRQLEDADAHEDQHGRAMSALEDIYGARPAVDKAMAKAVDAQREQHTLRVSAARIEDLSRTLAETRAAASQQRAALALMRTLGVGPFAQPASVGLQRCLDDTIRERDELKEAAARHQARIVEVERAQGERAQRRSTLLKEEPRWRDLAERAARLVAATGETIEDRDSFDRARALVSARLERAGALEAASRERHHALLVEASALESQGGVFPPALLALRDELDASLLATRFEDLPLEQAGLVEARLGELAGALVVEEPEEAARAVASSPAAPPSVWLVSRDEVAGAVEEMVTMPDAEAAVFVAENRALRVTRVPDAPRLGRRAREQRAFDLRVEAERVGKELDAAREDRRSWQRLVEDGDVLLEGHVLWRRGDPSKELATIAVEVERDVRELEELRVARSRSEDGASALSNRSKGLQQLLGQAPFLDMPDQEARLIELERSRADALEASRELARREPSLRVLDECTAALRHAPRSKEERAALAEEVQRLARSSDELADAIEALDVLSRDFEALAWTDAEEALGEHSRVLPALEAQLRQAQAAQERIDTELESVTERWTTATRNAVEAEAALEAKLREVVDAETRLAATAVLAPGPRAIEEAEAVVERKRNDADELDARRLEVRDEIARKERDVDHATQQLVIAEEKLTTARRELEPAQTRWDRLRQRCVEHGVLGGIGDALETVLVGVRGQVALRSEAQQQRVRLEEKLRVAKGGVELVARLAEVRAPDGSAADVVLDAWLVVRGWLRSRLPGQLAEIANPKEALIRLRDQLAGLEERLRRHEDELRGRAEDIARAIEQHIRRARGQVKRLTDGLASVRFGTVHGVRVRLEPVEQMAAVLLALRQGTLEDVLFDATTPFEEALDTIFRRHGGRSGGTQLLDYREYVRLQIEIQRQGSSEWEVANPSRLSTGEAIGVGAALMMVVLTEWERDSSLLRRRRAGGTLRFLFLDEANRLSQDNLGVLFDLCQSLDLQLLIAAPEVARAGGNTTYRLVRTIGEDGVDHVDAYGRRAKAFS